jgi:hypothetical protein
METNITVALAKLTTYTKLGPSSKSACGATTSANKEMRRTYVLTGHHRNSTMVIVLVTLVEVARFIDEEASSCGETLPKNLNYRQSPDAGSQHIGFWRSALPNG